MMLFFIAAALGSIQPAPGEAADQTTELGPERMWVLASDLRQARHVIDKFFKKKGDTSCFKVIMSREKGNLRVDFTATADPGAYYNRPPRASCGDGYGVILDKNGKVIEKFYHH